MGFDAGDATPAACVLSNVATTAATGPRTSRPLQGRPDRWSESRRPGVSGYGGAEAPCPGLPTPVFRRESRGYLCHALRPEPEPEPEPMNDYSGIDLDAARKQL